MYVVSFAFLLILSRGYAQKYTFPLNFEFGVATASYQIEGAWDKDGKGENIWDRLTHNRSSLIADGSTGDIACDSYHQYERDIEMIVELEVDFYRFSLSWSRILPTGFSNDVNEAGIDYYNKLIDGLIARNIKPIITIYHWDLPQRIQDLGGWTNEVIVDYFADYSEVVFAAFGDRVKTWITINEPIEICSGYESINKAPAYDFPGISDYLCAHNIIRAHAKAYHIYNDVYRNLHSDAIIGITLSSGWYQPQTESDEDLAAAEKIMQCTLGWFSHPIFSDEGDYPKALREAVGKRSAELGYPESRLPKFTAEEIEYIKGTSDFFGINHYTSHLVSAPRGDETFRVPSRNDDVHVPIYFDESWPTSASVWLRVVPWGFRKLLSWISREYNNVPIFITENGFSTTGGIEDEDRVSYYREYLKALLEAIYEDDCNIIGYTAWSLMDNFEWMFGYTARFGIYEVDFDSLNRTRTMRKSANVYRDIIRNRAVIED